MPGLDCKCWLKPGILVKMTKTVHGQSYFFTPLTVPIPSFMVK